MWSRRTSHTGSTCMHTQMHAYVHPHSLPALSATLSHAHALSLSLSLTQPPLSPQLMLLSVAALMCESQLPSSPEGAGDVSCMKHDCTQCRKPQMMIMGIFKSEEKKRNKDDVMSVYSCKQLATALPESYWQFFTRICSFLGKSAEDKAHYTMYCNNSPYLNNRNAISPTGEYQTDKVNNLRQQLINKDTFFAVSLFISLY